MPKGFAEESQAEFVKDSAQPPLQPRRPQPQCFRATVGPGGRIVIPADIRRQLAIKEGDALVGAFDGKDVKLVSLAELIRQAQDAFKGVHPEGVSAVDEFLKERRAMWGEED